MELTVRAIDVGFGNTKFVSAATNTATGTEIRCGSFPSMANPSPDGSWPGTERRKTLPLPWAVFSIEGVVTAATVATVRKKPAQSR